MKNHLLIVALVAAMVLVIPTVMACPGPSTETCYCGNWQNWNNGRCPQGGPHENDCCQDRFVTGHHGGWYHQHGELICSSPDPDPEPTPVEQSTGFYAFTAGPCSAPARIVNLSEKDGRTYLVRAAYMGFIDNLTISTYYEVGDSDIPYYQLNSFITSTSGMGIVSLSSGGAVARSFEYTVIKDETSTPDGWQIRGELVDMSTGVVVDTQSTEGPDTCMRVLYNLSPSQ